MSRGGWRFVALGAMVVQLAVLYVPRAPSVDTGGLPLDKVVHAGVFALPVVALLLAGAPTRWVVGLMAAHAVVSEAVQGLVLPDRSADPLDAIADLAGVALGALLARALAGRGRPPAAVDP